MRTAPQSPSWSLVMTVVVLAMGCPSGVAAASRPGAAPGPVEPSQAEVRGRFDTLAGGSYFPVSQVVLLASSPAVGTGTRTGGSGAIAATTVTFPSIPQLRALSASELVFAFLPPEEVARAASSAENMDGERSAFLGRVATSGSTYAVRYEDIVRFRDYYSDFRRRYPTGAADGPGQAEFQTRLAHSYDSYRLLADTLRGTVFRQQVTGIVLQDSDYSDARQSFVLDLSDELAARVARRAGSAYLRQHYYTSAGRPLRFAKGLARQLVIPASRVQADSLIAFTRQHVPGTVTYLYRVPEFVTFNGSKGSRGDVLGVIEIIGYSAEIGVSPTAAHFYALVTPASQEVPTR